MKLLPLSLFVFALLLGATPSMAAGPPPVTVRDKWALVVGIGQFEDAGIKPLAYGAKSAQELASIFGDPNAGRFALGHVHLLLNDRATRYGIERTATESWLFKKALPNDLIVVYIATRMVESNNHIYLYAADSIASDIENTGISLEDFFKNLRERTQCRHIICVLDTALQTKTGSSDSSDRAGEALSQIANRSGVSVLCASETAKDEATGTESPLIHFLCENIKSTQGSASLNASSQYVTRNLEEESRKHGSSSVPKIAMYLTPDNDLLSVIPLGLPIKSTFPLDQLHFGHPVDSLAIDRPDLDRMINTHNMETTDEQNESVSQIDLAIYLDRMKNLIQTKWQPPIGFEDRSVATTFTIAKDGTIDDVSVIASSGSDDIDNSALAALKAASPLEPLPPGSPQSVQIRYKFKWHANPSK